MFRNEPESVEVGPEPGLVLTEYRAVNPMAVAGLLVGLGAPLAMFGPLLWIVPALGVAICGLALRSIVVDSDRWIGRKAALVGLALSIVFGLAGPSKALATRLWTSHEARIFGGLWFDLLKDDQPHKAHQLDASWDMRKPLDEKLWNFYRITPDAHLSLGTFVEDRLVRTMLALGERAEVRLWEAGRPNIAEDRMYFQQYYAVTYDDATKPEAEQRTTFFVGLTLERSPHPRTGEGYWRIFGREGGVRPPSLERRGR